MHWEVSEKYHGKLGVILRNLRLSFKTLEVFVEILPSLRSALLKVEGSPREVAYSAIRSCSEYVALDAQQL